MKVTEHPLTLGLGRAHSAGPAGFKQSSLLFSEMNSLSGTGTGICCLQFPLCSPVRSLLNGICEGAAGTRPRPYICGTESAVLSANLCRSVPTPPLRG